MMETKKRRYFNTYKLSNHDNNNFILLLQKDVYPIEYIDDWGKFNETLLPAKKNLYSHLSIEDITNANYTHAKRVWKGFKINNVGDYHDLYVKHDKLLVADVFENFWNMCLEIYELSQLIFFRYQD